MNNTEFDEVKRRLRPGDVFQSTTHDWKTQTNTRWKGSCPWHDSSSGTCFTVAPETLEWHCFSCERGGGPLQYVAELEGVGSGARGALKGKEFFRAWEALARHAGCKGPPDSGGASGTSGREKRRPLRNAPTRSTRAPQRAGSASIKTVGTATRALSGRVGTDTEQGGDGRKMTHTEAELREALVRYREALSGSERARAYVEGRGLSVETLHAYGCGFAPAGEWIDDDVTNESGTHIHRAPNGRIVTPHTTAAGRLVCLSGRAVEPCPDWKRKRHLKGHTPALFNAAAIEEGPGPLVLCEGPLDALSFIEAGWERTVALHNTDGVPWKALRGNVEALVFAFDRDDTGRKDAKRRAREALLRGFDSVHTLHDEGTYEGHNDPNAALQDGDLSLEYLEGIAGDGAAEGAETAADGSGAEEGQSPTPTTTAATGGNEEHTAADLVPYWDGDTIGHLGRWLWERGGVEEGPVARSLYADRALHQWIATALQRGPQETTARERQWLRWALWHIYSDRGPEDVPPCQIPIPPMQPQRRPQPLPHAHSDPRITP
jgi:hypothetical protein